MGTFDGSTLI